LGRTESNQEFAELHSRAVAAFAPQDIDVLDQALAEHLVERFTLLRQVESDLGLESCLVLSVVLRVAAIHDLKVERERTLERIQTPLKEVSSLREATLQP
jgi:hypothetical protein